MNRVDSGIRRFLSDRRVVTAIGWACDVTVFVAEQVAGPVPATPKAAHSEESRSASERLAARVLACRPASRGGALLIGLATVGFILLFADWAIAGALPPGAAAAGGAQPENLDSVLEMTGKSTAKWAQSMISQGRPLFYTLAAIEFVKRMVSRAFQADLSSVVHTMLEQFLQIGFWAFVLESGATFPMQIVDSLQEIGMRSAMGGNGQVSPQALANGLFEFSRAQLGHLHGVDFLMYIDVLMAWMIVFVSYGICVAFVWLALMRAQIVAGGGAIMLAFGGSSWTSGLARNYLHACLACGLNLMVIELVKGLVMAHLERWLKFGQTQPGLMELQPMLEMAISGIAMLAVLVSVPGVVAAIASGSPASPAAEMLALGSSMKLASMALTQGATALKEGASQMKEMTAALAQASAGPQEGGSGAPPPAGGNGSGDAPAGPTA